MLAGGGSEGGVGGSGEGGNAAEVHIHSGLHEVHRISFILMHWESNNMYWKG